MGSRYRSSIKDPIRESHLFHIRALQAGLFTLLLILLLIIRLFHLQVLEHDRYTTLSHNNRVTIQPLPPTRGLIYDRNGVLLADNIATFSLELVPERIADLNATLATIATLVQVDADDRQRFQRELRRHRRFEAIPLRFRLSDEEVARIAVNRYRLPGVEINARLLRHYPFADTTAHSVGYVGRINERELQQIDATAYAATDYIGKLGVERSHEAWLHGEVGMQQVETNAHSRVLRVLNHTPAQPGSDLHLHLDIALQRVAELAFGEERGALVALDPATGAVLALVSVPAYDPNLFVNGIATHRYRALNESVSRPLFNRALRGQYPPGSTTKPFVGLLGLESGVIDHTHTVYCPGFYQLKGSSHRYRDWKKWGHGTVDLHHAISESCDVYFYDLAFNLGIDRMHDYLTRFGFGRRSGIDIGGESRGLMPSREWKRLTRNQPWYPGETLITGIGQGFMLATPIQLAAATATLASGGIRYQPLLVQAIQPPGNTQPQPTTPQRIGTFPMIDPDHWQEVVSGMIEVVHGARGTARRIGSDLPYQIAGKTGTAQVFSIAQDSEYVAEDLEKRLLDHALFIAFAPADAPRIAIAVVVENGGSGSSVAAPIARTVIEHYLAGLRSAEAS